MKRRLYVLAVASLFTASPLTAQVVPRNAPHERKIEDALASMSAPAVPTFRRATQAMDARKFAEAEPLYREVLRSAPEFTPAMRRLGDVLMALGRDNEGLTLLNRAVQIDRSAANLSSLANGLAYRADGKLGSTEERTAALRLAKEAAQLNHDPEDESYDALVAQLALNLNDIVSFRQSLDTLTRKYPQKAATHYFGAVGEAIDEHWERAEAEIREADRLGLPHEVTESFLASGVHTRAAAWRYVRYAVYALLVWAVGLLLLFVTAAPSPRAPCHRLRTPIRMSSRPTQNDRCGESTVCSSMSPGRTTIYRFRLSSSSSSAGLRPWCTAS